MLKLKRNASFSSCLLDIQRDILDFTLISWFYSCLDANISRILVCKLLYLVFWSVSPCMRVITNILEPTVDDILVIKLWQQMLSEVYWFTNGTVFRWFLCYSVFLPLKIFVSSTPPRRFEIQHCNFAWSLVMVWSYVHRDMFLLLRSNMAAGLTSLNFGYFVIKERCIRLLLNLKKWNHHNVYVNLMFSWF